MGQEDIRIAWRCCGMHLRGHNGRYSPTLGRQTRRSNIVNFFIALAAQSHRVAFIVTALTCFHSAHADRAIEIDRVDSGASRPSWLSAIGDGDSESIPDCVGSHALPVLYWVFLRKNPGTWQQSGHRKLFFYRNIELAMEKWHSTFTPVHSRSQPN